VANQITGPDKDPHPDGPDRDTGKTALVEVCTVPVLLVSICSFLYGQDIHGNDGFGRPFVKRFALCYRTVVLSVCLSVCDVGVLWPNGWTDHGETWRTGRLCPGHIVLDGDPAPPPPKGTAPNFRPISVVAKWLDGSRCQLVWR